MQQNIHIKSALSGAILGASAILLMGAVTATHSTKIGRFQIGATDTQAVILDTQTGQAWSYNLEGQNARHSDFFKTKTH